MNDHTAYDYRMYDNVWQRVSPNCDPYGESSDNSGSLFTPPQTLPAVTGEAALPGAQLDPCCMGSAAMESLSVLEGFIESELAQKKSLMALSARLCKPNAARLVRMLAQEKSGTVRELNAAHFLITGACYEGAVHMPQQRCLSTADMLRACYHREACSGFNYRRAADETTDSCLQKIFEKLSDRAFSTAEVLMDLIGHMLC